MQSSSSPLEEFVCPAAEAVEFKFVRTESDFVDQSAGFKPEFTHQVFGENEMIFGYTDLRIKLYFTPGDLTTLLSIQYGRKLDPSQHEGIKADDILELLTEAMKCEFITNESEFFSKLPLEAKFCPHGNLLEVYTADDVQYELYKVTEVTPDFADYHSRLQVFLLWFVDASSFIDIEDNKWNFYLLYQKSRDSDGQFRYAIVGYLTLYNYFSYPDKTRPRISQVLILPPYQRSGHGTKLLSAVYCDLIRRTDVYDITVEDPSDGFVALRDMLDCRNCQQLPAFQSPLIHQPFSEAAAQLAREKYKINKKQCRRVYEILRLRATDCSNSEQYRSYRLLVKNRLNAPFQKEKRDLEKLKYFIKNEELSEISTKLSGEERIARLQETYKQLEQDYRLVIDKLTTL